jgi:hypothetical protein
MNGIVYPYGSSHLVNEVTREKILANKVETITLPSSKGAIKATTLIQFSGGIDSTFVLWWWLVNHPDEYCVVHHIDMIHFEKRNIEELKAVDRVLKWLDSQGLKNYFYIQNTFDYGNIPGAVYDVKVCGFVAGIILSTERWESISKVYFPIYGHETHREENRRKVMHLTITSGREVECIYPLVGITKTEVMKMMPYELLKLCWYCRVPIDEKICGRCHTCKQVEEGANEVIEENLKKYLKGF